MNSMHWGGCQAYVVEPRVAGEEGLQAHTPVLTAPQDAMAALGQAHVAAPGLLQLGIRRRARAHQHLQALHTEAPTPGGGEEGWPSSGSSPASPTLPTGLACAG